MYPDRKTALEELERAGAMNPGPWTAHSLHVAEAAEAIASRCAGMDADKAYVCGLLHDIGRREGVYGAKHIIDGYDYAMSHGWDEVAQVCLTHSFPVPNVEKDVSGKDYSPDRHEFISRFVSEREYDDYDRLIILCDALADAAGFCILEKRFVDVTMRYGVFPFTIERWSRTFEYKKYFESKIGQSVYRLLPGIEQSIYI